MQPPASHPIPRVKEFAHARSHWARQRASSKPLGWFVLLRVTLWSLPLLPCTTIRRQSTSAYRENCFFFLLHIAFSHFEHWTCSIFFFYFGDEADIAYVLLGYTKERAGYLYIRWSDMLHLMLREWGRLFVRARNGLKQHITKASKQWRTIIINLHSFVIFYTLSACYSLLSQTQWKTIRKNYRRLIASLLEKYLNLGWCESLRNFFLFFKVSNLLKFLHS